MTGHITVAVIDDHPLFRAGVVRALELSTMINVVAEGQSAADAIEIARSQKPEIMLLDVSMPGDGIAALGQISAMENAPKIAMLTVSEDDDHVIRSLEAGALGYILKGIAANELIHAIKKIAEGEVFCLSQPDVAHPFSYAHRETHLPHIGPVASGTADVASGRPGDEQP